MSRLPATHARMSHAELQERLGLAARAEFARGPRGAWNPSRGDATLDLGRGVLDALALALHVLWTYQEAWAEEGFLATAKLDESADRLLAAIGYQLSPGTAAVGLQHFRCRAGMTATLPQGFAIRSPAEGEQKEATFETLEMLHLWPELNELRAYLPPDDEDAARAAETAVADTVTVAPPKDGGLFPAGSIADSLYGAMQDQRLGDAATRAAARARQKALRLKDMMTVVQEYVDQGHAKGAEAKALKDALEPVCDMLCEAQKAAEIPKTAPASGVGELTESQEILARQLKQLQERNLAATADLEAALKRCGDESDEAYGARLAAMARFLDAFVASLVQDARDQIVLLHGIDALTRLDQALGGEGAPRLGQAKAGCDALFLLAPGPTPGSFRTLPMVRPGDWFVIAEDVSRTDTTGKTTTARFFRRALRVLRVSEMAPAEGRPPLTRIVFEPPLSRGYELAQVTLLGNIVPISEGSTVIEENPEPSADRGSILLQRAPLTWLRDPNAPSGRRPEVELEVGGRPWRRVASLLDPAVERGGCYAVEPLPGGGVVLRTSDGLAGTALPDVPVRVRYRVGLGAAGNRAARRVRTVASSHPAVEETINPLPTWGGTDAEPRALARVRGPRVTSAMDRAVSLADVQALALAFDGVLRARVFRQGTARRAQVVVVVTGPDGAELSGDERTELRRHLAARVPPGVEVIIDNRVFVPVYARIRLRMQKGTDPLALVRAARLRLGVDRAPGSPPGLLDPANVEIDADLELSQIYGALEGVRGLRSLVVERLWREGASVRSPALMDRIVAGPRELLGWARPTDGTYGVELPYEEARDL